MTTPQQVLSTPSAAMASSPPGGKRRVPLVLLPLLILLFVFLVAPATILLVYSFWQGGNFQVVREITVENYLAAVTSPTYRAVLLNAMGVGVVTATITAVLSYVVAYWLRFRVMVGRNLVLYLILLSMLSGYLMRVYAWRTILGRTGLLNSTLLHFGLVDQPVLSLAFSRIAVALALINIFIPFAVLPIQASLSSVPDELIEAARDLGLGPTRVFWRVTLPLTMSGVYWAFLYTLILSAGDYITPELLGGVSGSMIGRSIAQQFVASGDQPMGAALSFVVLAVYAVIFLVVRSLFRRARWLPR